MKIGTSHFKDLVAAIKYYRSTESLSFAEGVRAVNTKLQEGSIHLGPPAIKANEKLSLNSEGRYFITEN